MSIIEDAEAHVAGPMESACISLGIPTHVDAQGRICCWYTPPDWYVEQFHLTPGQGWMICDHATLPPAAAVPWVAASLSNMKPTNAKERWVEITHGPGAGPVINGKQTQQGRGILHYDDGRAAFVVVYNVKHDHPTGWVASVTMFESQAEWMPSCKPGQAIYSPSSGGWPWPNAPHVYACGYPKPLNGDDDRNSSFTLTESSLALLYKGALVKDPPGMWVPATFFATAPVHLRAHGQWVQISTPPGYQGDHFGKGFLHRGIQKKPVLIVKIGGSEKQPQARFVPNGKPFST